MKIEDPKAYEAMFQTSLLDTEQLLSQVRQLGINEDLLMRGQTEPTPNFGTTSDDSFVDDDLTAQLAQYGVTLDSIPY